MPKKICLLFLAFSFFSSLAEATVLPQEIPARVIRIVDGDTIYVQAQIWIGQTIETLVRIEGIDTPELKGRCEREKEQANAAKAALVALTKNAEVILHDIRADKYGGRVDAEAAGQKAVQPALQCGNCTRIHLTTISERPRRPSGRLRPRF